MGAQSKAGAPWRAPRSWAANNHSGSPQGLSAEPAPAGRRAGLGPYPRGSLPHPAPSLGPASHPGTWSFTLPAPRWLRRCRELRRLSRQNQSPVASPLVKASFAAGASQRPLPKLQSQVRIQQNATYLNAVRLFLTGEDELKKERSDCTESCSPHPALHPCAAAASPSERMSEFGELR